MEGLWAIPIERGRFVLDNIPFFVRGVSVGDVIEATKIGDEYHFDRVAKLSAHSTIRVVAMDESTVPQLREKMREFGCERLNIRPRLKDENK